MNVRYIHVSDTCSKSYIALSCNSVHSATVNYVLLMALEQQNCLLLEHYNQRDFLLLFMYITAEMHIYSMQCEENVDYECVKPLLS